MAIVRERHEIIPPEIAETQFAKLIIINLDREVEVGNTYTHHESLMCEKKVSLSLIASTLPPT